MFILTRTDHLRNEKVRSNQLGGSSSTLLLRRGSITSMPLFIEGASSFTLAFLQLILPCIL